MILVYQNDFSLYFLNVKKVLKPGKLSKTGKDDLTPKLVVYKLKVYLGNQKDFYE